MLLSPDSANLETKSNKMNYTVISQDIEYINSLQ